MSKEFAILSQEKILDMDPAPIPKHAAALATMRLNSLAPELADATASGDPQTNAYWSRWYPDADTRWIDFYTQRTGVRDHRYIPEDLFYGTIDFVLNLPKRASHMDDKSLYPLLFPGVRQAVSLGYISRGHCLSTERQIITPQVLSNQCANEAEIVIKPSRFTCGGSGIRFCQGSDLPDLLPELIASGHDYILQRRLEQHPSMASLNASSVNTIRAMSYLRENGEVVVLSSVVRIGQPGSPTDNVSLGGCSIGIDADGRLKGCAFDHDCHRRMTLPDGRPIPAGMQVPGYAQVVDHIGRMHPTFAQHRLISWDFAISPDGEAVFIEFNLYRSEIDFLQLNNGPLFGAYTDEVLQLVSGMRYL